jgi:hypothetical protein
VHGGRLFPLQGTSDHDPAIAALFASRPGPLAKLARDWFAVMRDCGADVREILHDGYPTVRVGDAAFAYVAVFAGHVNVGFFHGAELPDPHQLLVGSGVNMRHVKLLPDRVIDTAALERLIVAACEDVRKRLAPGRALTN